MSGPTRTKPQGWKRGFADKLLRILDPDGVISSPDELIVYECDALTGYRIKPIFVVLPKSAREVSEIIKLCNQEDIPFVSDQLYITWEFEIPEFPFCIEGIDPAF